jgi:hypothetical protein
MRAVSFVTAVFILCAIALTPPAAGALAPTVTSLELVEHPEEWDGRRITFTGEAIGSAMRRGALTWLHLNDDTYGMADGATPIRLQGYNSGHAVVIASELAEEVTRFGSHGQRGDRVTVEGVFHAADSRFGGDMLIEADALAVVVPGRRMDDSVDTWKPVAIAVLAVSAVLGYVSLSRRRRGAVFGHQVRP